MKERGTKSLIVEVFWLWEDYRLADANNKEKNLVYINFIGLYISVYRSVYIESNKTIPLLVFKEISFYGYL